MPIAELTCRELVELVTAYLDDTLPPSERGRFDAHLTDCPYCGTYLEQMHQTIRLLGQLPEERLAPDVKEELLQRFRTWKAE
jgi:anti-sigma factor RsiW